MIFPEIKIHQPDSFEDYRGELFTVFDQSYNELYFNHDKVAISRKNVLRGLHGDSKSWKLITCLSGEIYLVVVDFRSDSSNYLKWDSILLTSKNKKSVLVPPMFANGHLVLSDEATFFYKWSYPGRYPDVEDQFSLNWKDPSLNIHWPINNPILSERDINSKFIQ
jgi:dTDP-4-dehydrorhamnose 3,5-epimerase